MWPKAALACIYEKNKPGLHGRSTALFSSALSRLTSRIPTCCAPLVIGLPTASFRPHFPWGAVWDEPALYAYIRTPEPTRVIPNWEYFVTPRYSDSQYIIIIFVGGH